MLSENKKYRKRIPQTVFDDLSNIKSAEQISTLKPLVRFFFFGGGARVSGCPPIYLKNKFKKSLYGGLLLPFHHVGWGPFNYVFLLMGAVFHTVGAFCYVYLLMRDRGLFCLHEELFFGLRPTTLLRKVLRSPKYSSLSSIVQCCLKSDLAYCAFQSRYEWYRGRTS